MRFLALACAAALTACGGHSKSRSTSAANPKPSAAPTTTQVANDGSGTPSATAGGRAGSGDWTRFDYDAQRSGVGPSRTGITAANAKLLRPRVVDLDGTVDSSPIELAGIRVRGRARNVIVVTTSYGHTIALDSQGGAVLWEFKPPGISKIGGTAQITTATPVSDPDRAHVYVASPDGLIHKLVLATGAEVRSASWPARVTLDPTQEKIGGALNLSRGYVIAVVGGYIGDHPTQNQYQGHVVTIDRVSGRIVHVFNTLCSDHLELMVPRSCRDNDAAVWARSGAVVEPESGRLLLATGNGHFNGSTNWGDSVLELSPDASRLLHNYTPLDQLKLDRTDFDLGSTGPALLPVTGGRRLVIQGGKDGVLRLLDLDRLNGTTSGAGRRTGGELQAISTLGGGMMFTAPAVWRHASHTYAFVGDLNGLAGYEVIGGSSPRLIKKWSVDGFTTSPIVAGGLLYTFDLLHKSLDIRIPSTGRLVRALPAAVGHWNSPIALHGQVILPVGDYQDHLTHGVLYIYHLPGR